MARTRSQIQTLVESNTGRTDKSTLIQSLCDSALKVAMSHHPFQDAVYACDDIALTEDNTSVSISSLTRSSGTSISERLDTISARIVEAKKLAFTSGEHAAVSGDIITGASSGATAYVVNVEDLSSGAWGSGDAAGNLWIANKSGTFTDDESFQDGDTNTIAELTTDPGSGGSRNSFLKLRNRQWWDRNVINPEDNLKGWPDFANIIGDAIYFDRPLNDDLTLRLRVSNIPSFSGNDAVCPISTLDIFVEQYVSAMVYLSLGMNEKYMSWYMLSLGRGYDKGEVGGSLLHAINRDKEKAAEDTYVDGGRRVIRSDGITMTGLFGGSTNKTLTWY